MRPNRRSSDLLDVVLVAPGHLSSTPRMLREAEALHAAGHHVHVIAGRSFAPAEAFDQALLQRIDFPVTRVEMRCGPGRRLERLLARWLVGSGLAGSTRLAATAHSAAWKHLLEVARALPARLYLGHRLPGLIVATEAARLRRSRSGFDLEDFHPEETEFAMRNPAEQKASSLLLKRLVRKCSHFTAASPEMAARAEIATGSLAQVILNTYPLADAPPQPLPGRAEAGGCPAELVWFSQTVGPGRGLEEALTILSRMRTATRLSLRGHVSTGYRAQLLAHARKQGYRGGPEFLPPLPPDELVRSCAEADLGLSVELSQPPNRALCLTNKLFAYLLAGVPVWLSATPAQRALSRSLGRAAVLTDLAEVDATAALLDQFLENRKVIRTARHHAWALARERFCWDEEKKAFLNAVDRQLQSLGGAP